MGKINPPSAEYLQHDESIVHQSKKSAYKQLNGLYDWNRCPLTLLGCKAVVYKDGNTRGLWTSRGVDGWHLGPSLDHYRCDLFYIPKTQGYRTSGSAELFPQHCQLPNMSPHQHLRALTDELQDSTAAAAAAMTSKGWCFLKLLQSNLHQPTSFNIHTADRTKGERRTTKGAGGTTQRVIDGTPIRTIQRITNAPPSMQA